MLDLDRRSLFGASAAAAKPHSEARKNLLAAIEESPKGIDPSALHPTAEDIDSD